MKRSRFTEEQITGASKRLEDVEKTTNICRERGIHQAPFYKWNSKLGGVDVSEASKTSINIYFLTLSRYILGNNEQALFN